MQYAVDHAKAGDTVLFLGKGHEKTQEHGGIEEPWTSLQRRGTHLKTQNQRVGVSEGRTTSPPRIHR